MSYASHKNTTPVTNPHIKSLLTSVNEATTFLGAMQIRVYADLIANEYDASPDTATPPDHGSGYTGHDYMRDNKEYWFHISERYATQGW